jgi:hypothetical protein
MDIYLAVLGGPTVTRPLHQNPLLGLQTSLPFKEKGRGSGLESASRILMTVGSLI